MTTGHTDPVPRTGFRRFLTWLAVRLFGCDHKGPVLGHTANGDLYCTRCGADLMG